MTLEPEFWSALEGIATARGISLQKIVEAVDESRGDASLSSALRVFVLKNKS